MKLVAVATRFGLAGWLALVALAGCGGGTVEADGLDEADGHPEVLVTCQADEQCQPLVAALPCLKAACDQQNHVCYTTVDGQKEGLACDDGDACTGDDVCVQGVCAGAERSCDDQDPCTADQCSAGSGECVHQALPENAVCDDGLECTSGEHCQAGACVAAQDQCQCARDADCVDLEDGNRCNGTLKCTAERACQVDPATVVECDAGSDTFCRKATCVPASGECVPLADHEGQQCQGGDLCAAQARCTEGQCLTTAPKDCGDGQPCTADTCDPITGACHHQQVPQGGECEDGDPCTLGDTCDAAGVCQAGSPPDCADLEECTEDSCDPLSGECRHDPIVPHGCDDQDACTVGDACGQDGTCVPGQATLCEDGNPCTVDACLPASGQCVVAGKVTPGQPCDDHDPCTLETTCDADAQCALVLAKDCDDGLPCTLDSCDSASGECRHDLLQAGTSCDDGDKCTGDGACLGDGTCAKGAAVDCDDEDPCTFDTCAGQDGQCQHSTSAMEGQPCQTDVCLSTGVCDLGECMQDLPVFDCCYADAAECEDGDACTTEACDGHSCVRGAAQCLGVTAACVRPLCLGLAGCVNGVSQGDRVVLWRRVFNLSGLTGVQVEPEGGVVPSVAGLGLAQVEASALVHLPVVQVPRGTTLLWVRATGAGVAEDDALEALGPGGVALTAHPGQVFPGGDGARDWYFDASAQEDGAPALALRLNRHSLHVVRAELVHHGAFGCLGGTSVALGGAGNALHVAGAVDGNGRMLVAWLEHGSGYALVTAVGEGDRFSAGARVEMDAAFDVTGTYRMKAATAAWGWSVVHGQFNVAGQGRGALVRISPDGQHLDTVTPLSSMVGDAEYTPSVVQLPDGGQVVAFGSTKIDGDGRGVALRRLTPEGTWAGDAVCANTTTANDQWYPTMAVGPDRILVMWQSVAAGETIIRGRFFSFDLAPLEPLDYQRLRAPQAVLSNPDLAFTPYADGQTAVVYTLAFEARGVGGSAGPDASFQRFTATASMIGMPISLHTDLTGDQINPHVLPVAAGLNYFTFETRNQDGSVTVFASRAGAALESVVALQSGTLAGAASEWDWPLGVTLPFITKGGEVRLGRHGLGCAGMYECSDHLHPQVCADVGLVPLLGACQGVGCLDVCAE
jgi:hypothetical protein